MLHLHLFSVMISHDAIIAPCIYSLIGESFGRRNWVNFLDGIVIAKLGKQFFAIRKNRVSQQGKIILLCLALLVSTPHSNQP